MEQYLHTGGRVRGEWFPESIAGLFRASRSETQDDLDSIAAHVPISAAAAAAAARGEGEDGEGGQEGDDDLGDGGVAAAAAAAAARVGKQKRKMTKFERQEAELAAETAGTKRARLNIKIQQERARLESTKESGYHLRQNLDNLRAETQQYEDAIAQTKREMEMIQRETQILEERLAQSRSEYHWGLDQAERIRIEEEKIETILREKLSHVNCFPAEDHQILTARGFMFLTDVQAHFATQDTLDVACDVDGSLEYRSITKDKLIVARSETLVHMEQKAQQLKGKQQAFSLVATENHRLYARVGRTIGGGELPRTWAQLEGESTDETGLPPLQIHTAAEVVAAGLKDASACVQFTGRFSEGFGVGEPVEHLPFATAMGLRTEDQFSAFLELYGCWLTAGSMDASSSIIVFDFSKPEEFAYLENLMQRLGMPLLESAQARGGRGYWRQQSQVFVASASWCAHVEERGGVAETKSSKRVGSWVWHRSLGKNRVRSILRGLRMAEGDSEAACVVSTSSVRFRDDVMRLALHAGYSASFVRRDDCYEVSYTDVSGPETEPRLLIAEECAVVQQPGTVWCLSVPTASQLLMVRRVLQVGKEGQVLAAARPVIAGNTQVNDVSDRVHQLRQLEEEFKLKDVRIQQLETECAKYETQIALLDQLISKGTVAAAANGAAAATAAAPSLASALAIPSPAVPAPSPTPPAQAGAVPDPNFVAAQAASSEQAALAAVAAANAAFTQPPGAEDALKSEDVSMGVAGEAPVKTEQPATGEAAAAAATDATAAEVKPDASAAPAAGTVGATDAASAAAASSSATLSSAAPAVSSSVAASSSASAISTLATPSTHLPPLLPLPTGPNPSLPDVLASIHSSTSTIAHLTMSLKLHEEQLESSNRHLIDRDRAMKYMCEQIERFSNLNHELNYKLKASENLTLEERAKLEQSYKQLLFAARQKDEQSLLITAYEEKLKHFEQLLNVADVRASQAEEHVAAMMGEVRTSRMAAQVLQLAHNKLMREYEAAVGDKFDALEENIRLAAAHAHPATGGRRGLHHSSHSLDSNSSDPAAALASSPRASAAASAGSSAGPLSAIKEEGGAKPSVPRLEHTPSLDGGFGGINGLASPQDFGAGRRAQFDGHHAAAVANNLGSRFDAAFASGSAASSSSAAAAASSTLPPLAADSSSSSDSAAYAHRVNLQLTQQNKELSLKLNQLTHQNTQLQVALVKLAHRVPHRPPSSALPSLGTSPPPPAVSSPHTLAHSASTAAAATAAAATAAHHVKTEQQQHASPIHASTNGVSHMEIDSAPAASSSAAAASTAAAGLSLPASAASSHPILSSSHPLLSKSSSGGSAGGLHRAMSNSSPLSMQSAPRSPRPPLHPNRPVFQDDIGDL